MSDNNMVPPNNLKNIIFQALSSNASESIYFKDLDSKFLFVSKYHLDYFGLSSEDNCIGKTDFDFFTKEHALEAYNDEQEIIRTEKPIEGKIEQETWEGDFVSYVVTSKYPLYDDTHKIIGTWGHSVNVATANNNNGESKKQKATKENLNRNLSDNSKIDKLTTLKNTKAFYESMNLFYQDAMNSMNQPNKEHFLLLIDMNDFTSLKNVHRHKYADEVLIFISELIKSIEGINHHLYRYSGDEFAILIENSSYESAVASALSLLALFKENKFVTEQKEIELTASIGMSRFKESLPFGNIHDIINLTGKRLYAAKKLGIPTIIHNNTYKL